MRRGAIVLGFVLAGCGSPSNNSGSSSSTGMTTTTGGGLSTSTGGTATAGGSSASSTAGTAGTTTAGNTTAGGTTASATGGTTAGGTIGSAACPAQNTVVMSNFAFNPNCITISLASHPNISVTNNDSATHRVKCDSPTIDMGDQGQNATAAHTFTATGDYAMYCLYHSSMHLTVHVEQ